jgi:MFS family permease
VASHVGDFVQVLAQSWLVVDLTRSAAKVAAVAFAQALPRFFITLFAGVIVDRVDRRRLLLVTQSLAAAQSALFLVLLRAGLVTYPWVLALSLALGSSTRSTSPRGRP